jgi:hypothetical protein
MNESQFGFDYSWEDLKPVRPLVVVTFIVQSVGMLVGYRLAPHASLAANLFAGGALATCPGFLLGLLVQFRLDAMALRENSRMVIRIGLLSLLFSLLGFIFPLAKV